jgi:hypothetical protein
MMNAEICTIIGTAVGFISLLYAIVRNFKSDMKSRFDKIDSRFDKMESEIKEIRTGLNRMEGAFYSKDCCMLKDDKSNKNVG